LPAIGCGFLGPPSLSRSEPARSQFLKSCHEIRTPQRSPGMRGVSQSVHVSGRFLVGDEPPPHRSRPWRPSIASASVPFSAAGLGSSGQQWVAALDHLHRSGVATWSGCGRCIGRRTEEDLRLAFISGSQNPHPLFAKNAKRRVGQPRVCPILSANR
jgi:hypothetical protein